MDALHRAKRSLLPVVGLLAVLVSAQASANLCEPRHIQQRHRDEAAALKSESFSSASPTDYAGREDYNARVIACNRSRDSRGKDVEAAITAKHTFANDLGARTVAGKVFYMNLFWMRYGYQLERKAGTWTMTVPAEFHFPAPPPRPQKTTTPPPPPTLDIPMALANELGIACNTANHQRVVVNDQCSPGAATCCSEPYQACQVGRDEKFNGLPATTHLMRYWQRQIQTFWTRPGFTVVLRIINLNEIDETTRKNFEKAKIVWHIRMNDRPTSRAMFRASVGRPHPLYSGMDYSTIVHEFGHTLGLDDEYPEDKNFPAWRDCFTLSTPASYVMCQNYCNGTGEEAKGVYPWIITRRYAIGATSERPCKTGTDCPSGTYCDTGSATIGRNTCRPLRASCEACSANKQCSAGLVCQGAPAGKCIQLRVKSVGASCCKNDECISGSCNSDGKCQCTNDIHCSSNSYCAVGTLGIGKNECVAKGVECATCDSDSKCQSGFCAGKPLGKCATRNSKSVGQTCCRNDQCRSGSCNSDGVCQCKVDTDCASTSYCSVGFLGAGKNQCVAKGVECASCDSDSKCQSGFCAGKPLGKCATRNSKSVGQTCCRNDQCTSGQCASDKCVCTEDRHCPSGQKCKKPLIGTNHCE